VSLPYGALAQEGADVIAVDLCKAAESVDYRMRVKQTSQKPVRLVQKTRARIVAQQGDVRNCHRLKGIVDIGVDRPGVSTSCWQMQE
jgi:(+)-trans-carveol dehydrogenase